ncbi:MAG: deoxyribonuclease IV, partial [Methanomicrobium sp.]|nr:deoxyribonuclease IV [Methanomicrobium sp.]
AFERAKESGANTFQIFTGNPRGWSTKEIDEETAVAFNAAYKKYNFGEVVAHMPYLPNPASPKDEIYEKSCDVLLREILRCRRLGIAYLVTHLGSHGGSGREFGINRVADALTGALTAAEEHAGAKTPFMILLENTAGTKNSIGGQFADIGDILKITDETFPDGIGVCTDTCHAFAAGYDLTTAEGFERTIADFEDAVGLKRLKVIHLNDTKGDCASHLDRHEHIGLGRIGTEGLKRVVTHPTLSSRIFILETPIDERRGDKENIAAVKAMAGEK